MAAAFIPFSIDVVDGRTLVRWIEWSDGEATPPFFAQMIRERRASGAPERVSPLDALLTSQGPSPAGLVLHLSRCGSTLVMQSLAHAGCIRPISEAAPISQLLVREDIPPAERIGLLRGLIRALGARDDASSDRPTLVKFTSWNVLFLDILRAAFPDVPWLFLYREPLESMASHRRNPARWLTDEGFCANLTQMGRLPSLAGLDRDQRCAAMLAAYGQAALQGAPAPINLLNFDELPAALQVDLPAQFGLATTPVQQARIVDASRLYSKDPSRSVVFDAERERRERRVTDRQREIDRLYTRPVHAALERCRGRA
jgi:hypothetical protein